MTPLDASQVQGITGRRRPSAQARVLEAMRIPYDRRPDGTVLLFQESVTKVLTGAVATGTVTTWTLNTESIPNRSKR